MIAPVAALLVASLVSAHPAAKFHPVHNERTGGKDVYKAKRDVYTN